MKKLMAAAGALAVSGTVLVAPAAFADGDLVTVCHVSGNANSADSSNVYDWFVGHEIQVAESAVPALERKSDGVTSKFHSGYYLTPAHPWWATLADVDGSLTNADCAFRF